MKDRSGKELSKIFHAQARPPNRQNDVRRKTEGVNSVVCCRLCGGNDWPVLVRRLPLTVAGQSQLQAQILFQMESLSYGIIEIKGLTWMNVGALLGTMKFVHLERGDGGRLITCQVECFARRHAVCPITRTDVVIRPSLESAGGR